MSVCLICLSVYLYICLSVSLYLSVCLSHSLLISMLLPFGGTGSFCFSYKMLGYRKPDGTVNKPSPCLNCSWIVLEHAEILWGHPSSISLNTLHSRLSPCHLPQFFLGRESRPPPILNLKKQIEFQLASCFEPEREREAGGFLSQGLTLWSEVSVHFLLPLKFPPTPWHRDSARVCTCRRMPQESSFLHHNFFPNLFHFLRRQLFFPLKDLNFWKSKARGKKFLLFSFRFVIPPLKQLL